MNTNIYIEKFHSSDPRLKRIVHHDSRSKQFAFDTKGLSIVSVNHKRHIPIFNQGNVGSCTGNAGIGDLGTDPFQQTWTFLLDQKEAQDLYSRAQQLDGNGPFPPNDHGSSGLSIAKVLKKQGRISGYQHTFSFTDALKAMSQYAVLVGTYWFDDMFYPDKDGRVHPKGFLAGGHEYLAREVDVDREIVWFDNSWGEEYGVKGRFYMTFEDFASLLSLNGDVTVLIPPTITPPTPVTHYRTLRLTSPMLHGDDVRAVQRIVGVLADGWYGSDTKAAVVAFQTFYRLIPDGVVGQITRGFMNL